MDSIIATRKQDTGMPSDVLADLLARTALHDRRAFRRLYELTSPRLFAVVVRLVHSHAVAEEILHDCFISIWQHAGAYIPARSQPMTWMTRIVRNRALDHLRADQITARIIDDEHDVNSMPDSSPSALERMLAAVESDTLRDCLAALDANVRQVIAAAFYRGLTHEQLALENGAPLGTVKSWIRRGLDRLRRCIDAAQGEPE